MLTEKQKFQLTELGENNPGDFSSGFPEKFPLEEVAKLVGTTLDELPYHPDFDEIFGSVALSFYQN